MRKLEIALAACIGLSGYGLHMEATAIHRGIILLIWSLLFLGHFDVECAGLVFVK